MYYIDYHTHPLSHLEYEVKPYHNKNILSNFIKKAKQKGIKEIGFSDHDEFITEFNWKNLFYIKEKSNINVKLGIEIDYINSKENKIKKIVNRYDFDYVIGSVHKVNNWPVDHPDYKNKYKEWDISALYIEYFNNIKKLVKSNLFDIIGHLDLIKIFNYKISEKKLDDIIDELLLIIKEHNIAIEINTNGLNKPVKEIYPSYKIINKIVEMNIPITFGSDAHRYERVGENIEMVYKKLKELGCNKIATFNNRQRRDIDVF